MGPTRHVVKSGLFGSEKVIEPLLFLASTLTVTGGRWGGWSFRGPSPLGGRGGEVTAMYIDRGQQEAGMSEAAQSTMGHNIGDVYQP